MAYEGGRSMDVPKKNRPNTKAKIEARKSARKASGMSAQKFFVKTRMEEMAKRGKIGDKAALRKKFQSGEVSRKGFGAPKKKTGTGSSSTGSSSTGSSFTGSSSKASVAPKVSVKDTRNRPATRNMKPAPARKTNTSGTGTSTKQSTSNSKNPSDIFKDKYRNVPGAPKYKVTPYLK